MSKSTYKIPTRSSHPNYAFKTRLIDCPDAITRIVTFPLYIWRGFDRFTAHSKEKYQDTIAFCTNLSLKVDPNNPHHPSFSDVLHYWTVLRLRQEKAESIDTNIKCSIVFNALASSDK